MSEEEEKIKKMTRSERIKFEIEEFNTWKSTISCNGYPSENDKIWNIIMDGPPDSPYNGGKFKIEITLGNDYPQSPPIFKFKTEICHININGETICMETLRLPENSNGKYKSTYTIVYLLSQIFILLLIPNEDNAYGTYIDLYRNDYTAYFAKARELTREKAK